jgi:hypothetical protein
MEDKQQEPTAKVKTSTIYASILLLSIAAGAGLIYSLQPPKPPPAQLVYQIMLLDSENPISDFEPFVLRQAQGMFGISLVTSPKVPATLTTTFPAMSGPGQSPPPLRMDVVGEWDKDRVETDLTLHFRGIKTIQHIAPRDGETCVVELASNGADEQFHYALIHVKTVKPTPAGPLILVTPVPAPNSSSTTQSPN